MAEGDLVTIRAIAVGLWFAFFGVLVGATYLGFNPPEGDTPIVIGDAVWAASFIGFPTVGALIAIRLPKRPLGWILLTGPLFIMTGVLLGEGSISTGAAGRDAIALAANVGFNLGMTTLLLTPLFIPDGRLPNPRWRPTLACILVADAALLLTELFEAGPLAEYPGYTNPLGVEALKPVTDVVRDLEPFVILGALLIGVVSVFVRRRNATGQERRQLKWIALGAAVVAVVVACLPIVEGRGIAGGTWITILLYVIAFLALPVSIGIAILRYRLYDVDVIINRAVVYGALTAVLVGFYLLSILVFRRLVPLSSGSDLGVAASTLIVAAFFQPVRGRIQRFIDKRFYRRKYDSAAIVAAFGAQLRDAVELGSIHQDMLDVVDRTVQPEHASIWLREPA